MACGNGAEHIGHCWRIAPDHDGSVALCDRDGPYIRGAGHALDVWDCVCEPLRCGDGQLELVRRRMSDASVEPDNDVTDVRQLVHPRVDGWCGGAGDRRDAPHRQ
jgi:hypothetical protein